MGPGRPRFYSLRLGAPGPALQMGRPPFAAPICFLQARRRAGQKENHGPALEECSNALGQPIYHRPQPGCVRQLLSIECKSASYPHERSFERRATRRASEASLGDLDSCARLGPVEPKKWQALPEATLAARTHDFVAALITRAAALITERPLVELCGLPTEQSDMEPLNSQPSMEQAKRQAASAGSSQPSMERQQTKGPPNTIAAPVAPEALPTPAAPRRVLTSAATRPAPASGDIQGSMESAGA